MTEFNPGDIEVEVNGEKVEPIELPLDVGLEDLPSPCPDCNARESPAFFHEEKEKWYMAGFYKVPGTEYGASPSICGRTGRIPPGFTRRGVRSWRKARS